jgi:hypothetical protein
MLVRSVQARFVVIDPVVASFEATFDAHRDQDVRAVLARGSAGLPLCREHAVSALRETTPRPHR